MKKFKLTKNSKVVHGITLYQIQALKNLSNVKKGDLGGWIEKEENLSQDNNAQVYGDAWVFEDAQVYGDARVYRNAKVYDNAQVYGNTKVYGDAKVSGNAKVYGDSQVSGDAKVYGDAKVSGDAHIKYSKLTTPIITFKEPEYILASLNAVAVNGKYTLYKRVNKVNDGKYISVYDKNFKYTTGRVSTEKECDPNVLNSCSSGIHLSHPTYWDGGDTLIACEVKVEDIITCQDGKVRVKKCKVLGEVNI